jgi:hypothetical protein
LVEIQGMGAPKDSSDVRIINFIIAIEQSLYACFLIYFPLNAMAYEVT